MQRSQHDVFSGNLQCRKKSGGSKLLTAGVHVKSLSKLPFLIFAEKRM